MVRVLLRRPLNTMPAVSVAACLVALLTAFFPGPALAVEEPPPPAAVDPEAERVEAERREAERAEAERAEAERAEAERAEREGGDAERTAELTEKLRTSREALAAAEKSLVSVLAAYNRAHGDLVVARLDLQDARERHEAIERDIREAGRRRARSTAERDAARKALGAEAAAAYRAGSSSQTAPMVATEALVRSRDPDEFARGLTYLKAMLGGRAQKVVQAEDKIERSEAARLAGEESREQAGEELAAAEAAFAAAESRVPREEGRLQGALGAHLDRTGELARYAAAQRAATEEANTPSTAGNVALTEDLKSLAAESAETAKRLLRSSERIAAGRDGVEPWTELRCPVDGPTQFVNDWGFPRSGGRSHEGTDVFAERGTPVVAMADAVVQRVSRADVGLGGLSVTYEIDGHRVYNAHLDTVAEGLEEGDAVKAGQVIGTVGTSGNARSTPPHNHVGLSRPSGAPVNPYPVLRRSCR